MENTLNGFFKQLVLMDYDPLMNDLWIIINDFDDSHDVHIEVTETDYLGYATDRTVRELMYDDNELTINLTFTLRKYKYKSNVRETVLHSPSIKDLLEALAEFN